MIFMKIIEPLAIKVAKRPKYYSLDCFVHRRRTSSVMRQSGGFTLVFFPSIDCIVLCCSNWPYTWLREYSSLSRLSTVPPPLFLIHIAALVHFVCLLESFFLNFCPLPVNGMIFSGMWSVTADLRTSSTASFVLAHVYSYLPFQRLSCALSNALQRLCQFHPHKFCCSFCMESHKCSHRFQMFHACL